MFAKHGCCRKILEVTSLDVSKWRSSVLSKFNKMCNQRLACYVFREFIGKDGVKV